MMRRRSRPMGCFCDHRTAEIFVAVACDCRNMEVYHHDAQGRDFDPAVNYAPGWHGGRFPFASKTYLRRECSRKLAANALPDHNPRTACLTSLLSEPDIGPSWPRLQAPQKTIAVHAIHQPSRSTHRRKGASTTEGATIVHSVDTIRWLVPARLP